MNFGKSVKSLSTKFNFALRISKSLGGKNVVDGKKKPIVTFSDFIINKHDKNNSKDMVCRSVGLFDFYHCQSERMSSIISKNDLPVTKRIIEPEKLIKMEIPLRNITNKEVDLPCNIEKEMVEPTQNIISKQAINMIRVRIRKMRIHKRKKRLRKLKILIAKKRTKKETAKELKFQKSLKDIIASKEKFEPEKEVEKNLKDLHWVRPVTKVRGRLAPNWVIEEELEKERVRKLYTERVQECLNYKKKL